LQGNEDTCSNKNPGIYPWAKVLMLPVLFGVRKCEET